MHPEKCIARVPSPLCRGLLCLSSVPGVCSLGNWIQAIGHCMHLRNEDWDPQNMAGQDSTLTPKTTRYSRESGNHLSQSL